MHVPLSIHTHTLPLYLFSYYSIYLFFLYPLFFLFVPSFPLLLLIPSPSALSSFLFSSLLSLASFRLRLISLSSPPTSSLVYLILSSFLPHFLLSSPFLFLFFSSLSSLLFPFPCLCPRVSRSLSLSLSLYFHVPPSLSSSFPILLPDLPIRYLFFLLPPFSVLLSSLLLSPLPDLPISFPPSFLLLSLLSSLLSFPSYSLFSLFPSFPFLILMSISFFFFPSLHALSFFLRSSPSPSPFLHFYASSSSSLLFRLFSISFPPRFPSFSPLPFSLSLINRIPQVLVIRSYLIPHQSFQYFQR